MARILLVSLFDENCKGLRYLMSSAQGAGHKADCLILKIHADGARPTEPRKDEGYYGQLFFVSGEELYWTLEFIESRSPDIIGISVFSHFTGVADWLTAHVRRRFPQIPILWGGVDVMYNRERAIQSADMICTGEGEQAIVELLDSLDQGKDPAQLQGFWTRRNGAIIKQENRPIPKSLDSLAIPAYDPAGFWLVRGAAAKPFRPEEDPEYILPYVMTTRGCPSQCTYCYPSAYRQSFEGERVVRSKSVGRVMEEIRELLKHYPFVPFIKFADDVFGLNQRWAGEFRDAYLRNYEGMPFRCYVHPTVSRKPILTELKQAGLDVAVIGVQTGSTRVLRDIYNRPLYAEGVIQKFQEFRDLDIWTTFDLILYNPLEDESDLTATLKLLYELPRPFGFPTLGTLVVFQNFPIHKMMIEQKAPLQRLDNSNALHIDFLSGRALLHHWFLGLIGLASLQEFPKDAVEKIRTGNYFRDDPDMLVRMMRSCLRQEAQFIDEIWIPRTALLQRMASELQSIRGSRAHQAAERVRRAHQWMARQQTHFGKSDVCPYVDELPSRLLEQTRSRNLLKGSLCQWIES